MLMLKCTFSPVIANIFYINLYFKEYLDYKSEIYKISTHTKKKKKKKEEGVQIPRILDSHNSHS